MLAEAIGIGLVLSLVFSETLGLATGGLVVPGYFALYLGDPLRVAGTLAAALATWGFVRLLSQYTLLYGRRRTIILVLVGFLFGMGTHRLLVFENVRADAVGFIIPGLLAEWMERQGIVETVSALFMAAVLVRFVLILVTGGSLS